MRNDLVKPCDDCPFRNNGKGIKLHPGRIRELARTVGEKGHSFICHKTADHNDEGERNAREYHPKEQLCAGSLAFTLNVGDEMAKAIVQIRLHCDASKIARVEGVRHEVYESTAAWLREGTYEREGRR